MLVTFWISVVVSMIAVAMVGFLIDSCISIDQAEIIYDLNVRIQELEEYIAGNIDTIALGYGPGFVEPLIEAVKVLGPSVAERIANEYELKQDDFNALREYAELVATIT